jgi:hypothetical protein
MGGLASQHAVMWPRMVEFAPHFAWREVMDHLHVRIRPPTGCPQHEAVAQMPPSPRDRALLPDRQPGWCGPAAVHLQPAGFLAPDRCSRRAGRSARCRGSAATFGETATCRLQLPNPLGAERQGLASLVERRRRDELLIDQEAWRPRPRAGPRFDGRSTRETARSEYGLPVPCRVPRARSAAQRARVAAHATPAWRQHGLRGDGRSVRWRMARQDSPVLPGHSRSPTVCRFEDH